MAASERWTDQGCNLAHPGAGPGGTIERAHAQFRKAFAKFTAGYLTLILRYLQQANDEVIREPGQLMHHVSPTTGSSGTANGEGGTNNALTAK